MSDEQAAFSSVLVESDHRTCQRDMLSAECGAQNATCRILDLPKGS